MVKIKIKHEKNKHELDIDTAAGYAGMTAQVEKLTGVPSDRQKLILKGKELKAADDLAALLKENALLMLVGSAEKVPEKPAVLPTFIEDIAGGASTIDVCPAGLKNLGNTCYLNSTIQVFKVIPEYVKSLAALPSSPPEASETGVLTALKGVYDQMDAKLTGGEVVPMVFVMLCRTLWPQFDQQQQGHYTQQDAQEYCNIVLEASRRALRDPATGTDIGSKLFEGEHEVVAKCPTLPDEPVTTSKSTFYMLFASMDQDTSTIEIGLEKHMHTSRDQRAQTTGADVQFDVTQQLSRLPEYLWVNIVRFEWRKDISKKTKKLRRVAFPFRLDVHNLCSAALQETMKGPRNAAKEERDRLMEEKKAGDTKTLFAGEDKKDEKPTAESSAKKEEEKKEEKKEEGDAVMADASGETKDAEMSDAEKAPVGNDTGFYELCGIVTHKGRDADSGHYVGWTKQPDGRWMCHDDSKVYEVNEAKIQELAGGGEAHSAYLLLYRTRDTNGKAAALW